MRVRDGYQDYVLDYHPFDVVGWDGYVYPYTFNTDDFEPITGRIHMPPPVHQTFQGQNFVICSFCPRELDYDPQAIALPYHHSNVQSEEAIYYVDGQFGSRKGVDIGMITLHPSGLPHGPQPGLVEASLGARRTEELAVMWDMFRPLKLTALARDLDQPEYALSWYEPDGAEVGVTTTRSRRHGCSRRHSSTHRSRRATRAMSPSTSPTTTRRQRPRIPRAPQRDRRRGARMEARAADPADRLHRSRARGMAHGLPRAPPEVREVRVPRFP